MAIRAYAETIAVNGTSRTYQVETTGGGNGELEPIMVTLTGTIATTTLHASAGATSPLVFAAASGGAFTTSGSHIVELLPGALFKFVNSASASPQASVRVQIRGQIKILPA